MIKALLIGCLLGCLLVPRLAWGQAVGLPPQPAAEFAPRPGAALPLGAMFVDDAGRAVRLGQLFGRTPVVLVPVYYSCPNLCGTLFEGVLQSLALSGLPAGAYQLVGVSIDPGDTPARAAERRRAYLGLLPGDGLRLLTGGQAAVAELTAAIGYRYERDGARGEYAHAAGFVVATADGRVARYFPGVRFDPMALRDAVNSAARGETGRFADRLLLLCAHFDPSSGRYSFAALSAVRAVALAVVVVLLGWIWRHRTRRAAR
jgi:protein SCO1/2